MHTPSVPQIGPILHQRRTDLGLTLGRLAALSGVSKSMLSQIERGETNPTFAVLWSLTRAMQMNFATLLEGGASAAPDARIDVVCGDQTPEIRSADGRCRLRILSPPELAGATEWYRLDFEPAGRLESHPHSPGTTEHFTAETQGFEITTAAATHPMNAGDTARYRADVPHAIVNTSASPGRGYLVVIYARQSRKSRG
jgi:transcriptional regulator with XRE-family HTH domain